jgi:hypothetical protein
MNSIKFSHVYPKLWEQTSAKLVHVEVVDAAHLDPELVEYDTRYRGDRYREAEVVDEDNCGVGRHGYRYSYYKLPKSGNLLQLVFLGNKGIPFCTLRRYSNSEEAYYRTNIEEVFDIVVEEE